MWQLLVPNPDVLLRQMLESLHTSMLTVRFNDAVRIEGHDKV